MKPSEITTPQTINESLAAQLVAANEEIEMLKLNYTYFRYAHDEIEAACGGETALMVREKVLNRRARILGLMAGERVQPTPTNFRHAENCAAEQDVRNGFDHIRDCDCGAQ